MFAAPINMFSLAYPETTSNWTNRFQMFATKNMWTFILLDSYNGRLWQVQYSTQDLDNLMIVPINKYELISDNERCIFSIQPLTSMYQYYLINDNTGDMWKFQWSTKGDDYRWIEKFKQLLFVDMQSLFFIVICIAVISVFVITAMRIRLKNKSKELTEKSVAYTHIVRSPAMSRLEKD